MVNRVRAAEAVRRIAAGEVAPVYLVAGPDEEAHREVLEALRRTLPPGLEYLCCEELPPEATAGEVARAARSVPLAGRRMLVLREGEVLRAGQAALAPLIEYLRSPSPTSTLVLCSSADLADGGPLLAAVAGGGGMVVSAAQPRPADVVAWLREEAAAHGVVLPEAVVELLLERCGRERRALRQELAKLACAPQPVSLAEAERLLARGREERVFDLVEAAFDGHAGEALRLADALLRQGEEVPSLIGLLASQVRLLWHARALLDEGRGTGEAAAALGVRPFQAERLLRRARGVTYAVLGACFETLLAADRDVKTGQVAPGVALELACLRLAATGPRPRSRAD